MSVFPQELVDVIASRGGLDSPTHSDPWTRHLISQGTSAIEIQRKRIEAIYFKTNGLSLHSAIYNSLVPGAFSYLSRQDNPERRALVGISYGFIYNAACLASLMLGRNDMFTEVGSPQKEVLRSPLSYIPSNLADSEIHPIRPNCPIRRAFSAFLLARFVESVFMHEVAHLVRGHLGFISKTDALSWSEGDEASLGLESLTKQALEFDADTGAVEESCNYFLVIREQLLTGKLRAHDNTTLDALKCLNSDLFQGAKYVFMAMYLPLRMFEVHHWERKSQADQSHPRPPIRMLYLMFNFGLGVLSDEIFGLNPELAKETVLRWAHECEKNYMALQDLDIDPRGLASAWNSNESAKYIESIHTELSRIEPLLAPHVIKSSV